MQKAVAIIGTNGQVDASFLTDTRQAFAVIGHNTGNLAFQHAVWSLIADEKRLYGFDFEPAAVAEACRLVCIPAANFLYSGFDLGGLADRLSATGLPLLVLGLGAQAFRDIAEVKLQSGTERLLRVFGERCKTIAVRGRYTGAVLEKYGIRNFEILGCPSNFINPEPTLGARIAKRWTEHRYRVGFAPTFYSYNAEFERGAYMALERQIVEIVAQDPLQAVAVARGDHTPESVAWLQEKAGFLSALKGEARGDAVAKLTTYFSAEAWLEAYRRLDAVIGSRIHGVNLAWQAGRAALVVSYDLRTEELAETMGIPMVKSAGLKAEGLLEELDARVASSAANYDRRRADLASRLAEVFTSSGVTHSPALSALAEALPTAPETRGQATPAKKVWGFLEQYNRHRIAGWVASSDPEPPRVAVLLDGREIGVVAPSRPRPEVGQYGWSFELAVPQEALTRDVMRVEAMVADSRTPLRNSPVVTSFAADDEKKVLRGQQGWLFLQNDTNRVLDQIQGKRTLTSTEMSAWARFLEDVDSVAEANDAEVFYLVAPNKECVFADRLPSDIRVSERRPVHQLAELLRTLGLRRTHFIYPLDALQNASAYATYPKGDSHWSDYGALVALEQLYAAGNGIFGSGLNGGAPEFRSEYRNTDLLSKLGGVCVEPMPVLKHRFGVEMVHDNNVINTGRVREFRATDGSRSGKLLLLHDSFGEWLIPHLAERFSTTTAVWASSAPREVIEKIRPSAIVFERAERFLVTPPPI